MRLERTMQDRFESRGCVLVADDDHDIRMALRLLLEDEGYQVAEADDGPATLAFLRQTSVECIVLLDLVMPRLNGMEVARAIAADDTLRARVRVIVCTARSQALSEEEWQLMRRLDATLMQKPFNLEDMLAAVRHARDRLA
jgi:CheY-like chemotaxis protein